MKLIARTHICFSLACCSLLYRLHDSILWCIVGLLTGTLKEAQLVLLEQPVLNQRNSQWSLTVIKESACDSNVALTSFNLKGLGGNYDVIYASGFYLKRLALFYTTNMLSHWTDPKDVRSFISTSNYFDSIQWKNMLS